MTAEVHYQDGTIQTITSVDGMWTSWDFVAIRVPARQNLPQNIYYISAANLRFVKQIN